MVQLIVFAALNHPSYIRLIIHSSFHSSMLKILDQSEFSYLFINPQRSFIQYSSLYIRSFTLRSRIFSQNCPLKTLVAPKFNKLLNSCFHRKRCLGSWQITDSRADSKQNYNTRYGFIRRYQVGSLQLYGTVVLISHVRFTLV